MMSFHLLLAVLLFLFIGWRAVHPVKLSWGWKTVLYALTALAKCFSHRSCRAGF